MRIEKLSDLREAQRNGQFAWPGGYECAYLSNDGEFICVPCVTANLRQVIDSIHNDHRDGWRVVSFECSANYDDIGQCANCHRELSAYDKD